MKRAILAASVGGCGVSAALFIAWYARHRGASQKASPEEHREEECHSIQEVGRKKKVHFEEETSNGNGDGNSRSLTKFRGILLSQGDSQGIPGVGQPDETMKKDSPTESASSVSSYTSCDEEFYPTSGSDLSSSSTDSGANNSIDGTVGLTTYERYDGMSLSDSEFQDLLTSPVVSEVAEDARMERLTTHGRPLIEQYQAVQQYDPELSPSRVDEQCRSTCDIYGSIVMPLCPNTGSFIPEDNVTTRKRKAD